MSLVAIQRGGEEIIPRGKTILRPSDVIVTMTDERDSGAVYDKMENLCKEHTSHIFRDNDECLIMIEYLMKI